MHRVYDKWISGIITDSANEAIKVAYEVKKDVFEQRWFKITSEKITAQGFRTSKSAEVYSKMAIYSSDNYLEIVN